LPPDFVIVFTIAPVKAPYSALAPMPVNCTSSTML
jgi:hypothetical protein